jgi:hypothetical protein
MGTVIKVEKTDEGYWLSVVFDDGTEKNFLSFINPLDETE